MGPAKFIITSPIGICCQYSAIILMATCMIPFNAIASDEDKNFSFELVIPAITAKRIKEARMNLNPENPLIVYSITSNGNAAFFSGKKYLINGIAEVIETMEVANFNTGDRYGSIEFDESGRPVTLDVENIGNIKISYISMEQMSLSVTPIGGKAETIKVPNSMTFRQAAGENADQAPNSKGVKIAISNPTDIQIPLEKYIKRFYGNIYTDGCQQKVKFPVAYFWQSNKYGSRHYMPVTQSPYQNDFSFIYELGIETVNGSFIDWSIGCMANKMRILQFFDVFYNFHENWKETTLDFALDLLVNELAERLLKEATNKLIGQISLVKDIFKILQTNCENEELWRDLRDNSMAHGIAYAKLDKRFSSARFDPKTTSSLPDLDLKHPFAITSLEPKSIGRWDDKSVIKISGSGFSYDNKHLSIIVDNGIGEMAFYPEIASCSYVQTTIYDSSYLYSDQAAKMLSVFLLNAKGERVLAGTIDIQDEIQRCDYEDYIIGEDHVYTKGCYRRGTDGSIVYAEEKAFHKGGSRHTVYRSDDIRVFEDWIYFGREIGEDDFRAPQTAHQNLNYDLSITVGDFTDGIYYSCGTAGETQIIRGLPYDEIIFTNWVEMSSFNPPDGSRVVKTYPKIECKYQNHDGVIDSNCEDKSYIDALIKSDGSYDRCVLDLHQKHNVPTLQQPMGSCRIEWNHYDRNGVWQECPYQDFP
jgi:hypothetical protein